MIGGVPHSSGQRGQPIRPPVWPRVLVQEILTVGFCNNAVDYCE